MPQPPSQKDNPLFAVNYLERLLRHRLKEHTRETIAFGRSQGLACCKGLILDFGANGGQQAVRSVVRNLVAGVRDEPLPFPVNVPG